MYQPAYSRYLKVKYGGNAKYGMKNVAKVTADVIVVLIEVKFLREVNYMINQTSSSRCQNLHVVGDLIKPTIASQFGANNFALTQWKLDSFLFICLHWKFENQMH